MFDPIARRLASRFHPIGFDLRGHGASEAWLDKEAYTFSLLASDVALGLAELGVKKAYAVGVSLGGGVAIELNALMPDLLIHVVLAEAVAFGNQFSRQTVNEFAAQALRRRVNWPSRDEMAQSYGSKPPLNALAPEVMNAYLRWGAVDEHDGTVSLACPPFVEAALYYVAPSMDGGAGAFANLPLLRGRASIVAGSESSLDPQIFERQAEVVESPVLTVAAGHLLLHEDTDRAARLIADLLTSGHQS